MRKLIWITCAVILVVCILLLLRKTAEQPGTVPPEQSGVRTNQPSQQEQPKAAENRQAPNIARTTAVPPVAEAPRLTHWTSNSVWERTLTRWQVLIEFYGKVVDENSNAVAGADITFGWSEFPTEEGARRVTTKSDAQGFFSLDDKRGPALDVWVSKEGYYASHGGQRGFSYMNADFAPDSQNPVVFSLRKKGTSEPLVAMKRNYRIPRDGTSVAVDVATGANTTGENGNLVVRCWTNDAGKRSGEKYDWRCVVAIPGGGVVATDEEFPFLAPETGYKPTAEINMPANRTNWNRQVDLKFYYRLADGRYGRMTFSMIAGGQHFCMIDSVLNPSGSRNLEPAN